MLNLGGLKSAVGALLERSDTAMLTKIETFINEGLRYIYNQRPWMALLRHTTFSAVANLDYFISGQEVAEVIDISQRDTPAVIALQRYYALLHRNIDAMGLTTGKAIMASPMGEIGIKAALPSDGTITVESSSASDTTQYVRVRGYDASLLPVTEKILLTGVTPATSTLSYSSKEGYEPRFSRDTATVGSITVKRSTTTLAQIAPSENEARYKKWKVWPAFAAADTMYLTYKKRIYLLSEDEETPELECDNALIMFAFARCMQEKRQFAKAKEIYGTKDIDGVVQPGTFQAELDSLIAREPQFSENFTDQFIPHVEREPIDSQVGGAGHVIWPA